MFTRFALRLTDAFRARPRRVVMPAASDAPKHVRDLYVPCIDAQRERAQSAIERINAVLS